MLKEESLQQKTRFMPFQPKENMTIAPVCRRDDFLKMNQQEKTDFMKKIDDLIFSQKIVIIAILIV